MEYDYEEQTNELVALESILEPGLFTVDNLAGEIKVEPFLRNSSLKIVLKCDNSELSPSNEQNISMSKVHKVEYLPPITLNFVLPSSYPSKSPPEYVLSCAWLSRKEVSCIINSK